MAVNGLDISNIALQDDLDLFQQELDSLQQSILETMESLKTDDLRERDLGIEEQIPDHIFLILAQEVQAYLTRDIKTALKNFKKILDQHLIKNLPQWEKIVTQNLAMEAN